jgi:hypothetical protein
MDKSAKINLAEAAFMLLEPFHAVSGHALLGVSIKWEADDIAAVLLQFESTILQIEVDPEDDTLHPSLLSQIPAGCVAVEDSAPWSNFLHKNFGWGWIGLNQQGYLDFVAFSFDAVTPQISLTAVASAIRISTHIPHGSYNAARKNAQAIAA